jgi:hypothetical protein
VSQSKGTLSGNIGIADAKSTVSNIVLGPANVITIDSVVSTATASTDGAVAKASGSTKVNGMKIAGQSATVDENGVSLVPSKDPVNQQLNKLAQQALVKSGFKIVLTKPDGKPDGAAVNYNAGALVIAWEPQPGTVFSVTLGGATVNVNSSAGFDVTLPDTPISTPAGSVDAAPSGNTATASAPAGREPTATPSPVDVTAAIPAAPVATTPVSFFVGAPLGWIVVGAMGAGLAAFGLRKLSTDVLAEQAAVCRLERKA